MEYEVRILRGEGDIVLYSILRDTAENSAQWLSQTTHYTVTVRRHSPNVQGPYLAFSEGRRYPL